MTITTSSTSTTPSSTQYSELRAKQQQVWSSGDYNQIAALTVPVNEAAVAAAGIFPGEVVVDLASGTGHAALSAARQGGRVIGVDYVDALLDIARDRARAERLANVEFVEAPVEALPVADGSVDVIVSALGVMFAADHQAAANEIVRALRPGGRFALASWTATGFVGGMLATVGKHVTPPPGAQSPVRWGNEAVVAELLGESVTGVASQTVMLRTRFNTPEQFADLFLGTYGPAYSAASKLDEQGRTQLRADLVAHAVASTLEVDEAGRGIVIDWEFRIVTGTRS